MSAAAGSAGEAVTGAAGTGATGTGAAGSGAAATGAAGTVLAHVRRLPVTTGALLVLLGVALLTGSARSGPGGALLDSVGASVGGSPVAWPASALWCADTASLVAAVLATALLLGYAERRLGSRLALGAVVAGQVLGTAAGLAVVAALAAHGDTWAREISGMVALGPFPGLLAAAGLATARTSPLWRRRVRLLFGIALTALVLYSGTVGDVVWLTGWLVGLGAGLLLRTRSDPPVAAHVTRREGRALVALVLAATALGPLVAALSRTPDGPWAVVSHLFVAARPDRAELHAVCGPGGDLDFCRVLEAQARLTGHGPALLSVLPVLLQLVLAEGLRRGRRAAWVGATALTAVLAVVGGLVVLTVLTTPAEELPMLGVRPGGLPAASLVAPLLAPLVVLGLLLATRSRFDVRAAPGSGRRWLLAAGVGTAVVTVAYLTAGSLVREEFAETPSVWGLLADLPSRMLPPGYLGEVVPRLTPLHGAARWLADWTGVLLWVLLLATALRVVRPAAPAGDAVAARRLVERHGEGPLAFMTTWGGNRYWFAEGGEAVVAYRLVGGVALTTGDAVGSPAARRAAVPAFSAWCEEHGWTPCWYAVTDEVADLLRAGGARRLQVAAETWMPLADLRFTGRKWQDVRTALNRARREGLEARWTSWNSAPLPVREQLARLSEQWLADKGLPEMGFTLGGLDELADDGVRCLLAVGPGEQVLGLTSWLPAYRDGALVGWTLDVMRRGRTAPPGTVEFLIATALQTFQAEGAEFASLSGAPLALPPDSGSRGALERLLESAGRLMEPVYGFRSLLAFKAKFSPRYRPLWLVYPGNADLPRIARAVSRAYLPGLSLPQAARLTGALVRGHRRPAHPAPTPAPAHR